VSDTTSTGTSSSSSRATAAAPGRNASDAATAAAAAGQPRRPGPVEIQAFWQHCFSRVLTEVAAVLLTRSPRVAANSSAPAAPIAAPAAAEMCPRSSFDNPVMKSRVSSLLHFFATNSKWAVVELLTSHVYGYGSSARAMYTSKVLDEAQAAGSAATTAAAAAVAADAVQGSAAAEAPAGPTSCSPAGATGRPSPFAQLQADRGETQAEAPASDPSGQQGSSSSGTAAAAAACVPSLAPSVRSESGVSAASAGAVRTAKGPAQRGLLKLLRVKFKQVVGQ
jgi:hypothetical protein